MQLSFEAKILISDEFNLNIDKINVTIKNIVVWRKECHSIWIHNLFYIRSQVITKKKKILPLIINREVNYKLTHWYGSKNMLKPSISWSILLKEEKDKKWQFYTNQDYVRL